MEKKKTEKKTVGTSVLIYIPGELFHWYTLVELTHNDRGFNSILNRFKHESLLHWYTSQADKEKRWFNWWIYCLLLILIC